MGSRWTPHIIAAVSMPGERMQAEGGQGWKRHLPRERGSLPSGATAMWDLRLGLQCSESSRTF